LKQQIVTIGPFLSQDSNTWIWNLKKEKRKKEKWIEKEKEKGKKIGSQ